jgi:hypothetical protein
VTRFLRRGWLDRRRRPSTSTSARYAAFVADLLRGDADRVQFAALVVLFLPGDDHDALVADLIARLLPLDGAAVRYATVPYFKLLFDRLSVAAQRRAASAVLRRVVDGAVAADGRLRPTLVRNAQLRVVFVWCLQFVAGRVADIVAAASARMPPRPWAVLFGFALEHCVGGCADDWQQLVARFRDLIAVDAVDEYMAEALLSVLHEKVVGVVVDAAVIGRCLEGGGYVPRLL